jgi:hypothetical protein
LGRSDMARLSDEMQKVARDKMSRAAKRLNGAATAVARKDVTEGEFDNQDGGPRPGRPG